MIKALGENQVFVFGSNSAGFHGAGSAGLACRGESKNTWRTDPWFLNAMKSPRGSHARVGKWATYGEARGFQCGTDGKSYAIITIVRPGQRRSYPLEKIQEQIKELFEFAEHCHPEWEFISEGAENPSPLGGWDECDPLKIV
jgi:hypothetical protein